MISSAYANTAPAGPDPMFQILMLVGFIAIFYFLLWRPQQKRAKEHKNLIENLAKGDEVATGGGLMGRITRVSDDVITVEIANGVEGDGVDEELSDAEDVVDDSLETFLC